VHLEKDGMTCAALVIVDNSRGLHIKALLVEFGSLSAIRKLIIPWHNLLIITPAESVGFIAASI